MNPNIIPDYQKKAYLAGLNEDDFRNNVVVPLFVELGMRRGKDVCGVDEDGKDTYLFTKDSLRANILYVIQTKRGDVKMSSKHTDNVLNLITQMKTALNTPVKDAKTHQKLYPVCVMLVASGEINKAAQEHIVDELQDHRIAFQDSDDLIPAIDEHMSELWLGIDTRRLPYLKALREYLINQSDTIDMTQIGVSSTVASPITDDTFVQLSLHKYTKKTTKSHGHVESEIDVEEFHVQDLIKSV